MARVTRLEQVAERKKRYSVLVGLERNSATGNEEQFKSVFNQTLVTKGTPSQPLLRQRMTITGRVWGGSRTGRSQLVVGQVGTRKWKKDATESGRRSVISPSSTATFTATR